MLCRFCKVTFRSIPILPIPPGTSCVNKNVNHTCPGAGEISLAKAWEPGTENWHIPSNFIAKSMWYCPCLWEQGKVIIECLGVGGFLCANVLGCPEGIFKAGIERDIGRIYLMFPIQIMRPWLLCFHIAMIATDVSTSQLRESNFGYITILQLLTILGVISSTEGSLHSVPKVSYICIPSPALFIVKSNAVPVKAVSISLQLVQLCVVCKTPLLCDDCAHGGRFSAKFQVGVCRPQFQNGTVG